MEIANLTEVKNNLSRYIDQVRRGVRVRILVRGVPAADLVPVTAAEQGLDRQLADLERRGIVRRGHEQLSPEILEPGPEADGTTLSGLLVAERREGR